MADIRTTQNIAQVEWAADIIEVTRNIAQIEWRDLPILKATSVIAQVEYNSLVHYTLEAGAGTYTLTGTNAEVLRDSTFGASAGAYALTGSDITLNIGKVFSAGSGSYALTGTDAFILRDSIMSVGSGTYTLTGSDIDLIHHEPTNYLFTLGAGTYVLTGKDIDFTKNYPFSVGSGSYAITGADLVFVHMQLIADGDLGWKADRNLGAWTIQAKGNWDLVQEGPWPFTEQPDKFGFLNNKNWSKIPAAVAFSETLNLQIDREDKHMPCGHWHKGIPPVPVLSIEAMWQQSIDVLKSRDYLGVAGMSTDSEKEFVLYITDLDGVVKASHLWKTEEVVSGLPGTVIFTDDSGVPTVFYHNWNETQSGYAKEYCVYKLNTGGAYSRSVVYTTTYRNLNNFEGLRFTWGMCTMAISSTGTIVTAIAIRKREDSIYTYYINTRRSTNWGVSWEDVVEIPIDASFYTNSHVDCGTDGNFYITASDSTSPQKPFRLWKSTDSGASWVEIDTVPTTPVDSSNYLSMSISGTKIYIVGQVLDGTNKTYIWSSTDDGVTWTVSTVIVTGLTFFTYFGIKANSDVVILSGSGNDSKEYIIRSDDGGATWTKIGQRDPALDWPTYIENYETYLSLNNDEDIFVFTACRDYILDTNYLGYLFSEDDGLTWEAKALTLSRTSGVPSYGTALPEEPVVWKI